MEDRLYDVIVIGGGPAGLTAALYLARARYRVLVIEKEKFGGQITITADVVNYPGVEKASGSALTETMRRQAGSFGAEFLLAEAESFEISGDLKTVVTSRGRFQAFGLVLATGASPRRVGFAGEAEFKGHGVAYCATCDGEFFTGLDVFVIGGGFAAAEEAIFLTKYARQVTVLVRKDQFGCARSLSDAVLAHPKISVLFNTVMEEVAGEGALQSARLKNLLTGEVALYRPPAGESFGVFVFAGYEPATDLFRNIVELNEQGYILTDRRQKTNLDGVYGAGDVCVKNLRQVVTAVSDGAVAATELEKYAAAMQKKTGLIPVLPAGPGEKTGAVNAPKGHSSSGGQRPDNPDTQAGATHTAGSDTDGTADISGRAYADDGIADTAGAADTAGTAALPDREREAGRLFSPEINAQLADVFRRLAAPLILKAALDQNLVSRELEAYLQELVSLTDKLTLEILPDDSTQTHRPWVGICRADGSDTGMAFHGVPGGHEFNSFIIALYNAAGPGQAIEPELLQKIRAIRQPVDLKVLVSLSCTLCPELVMAAQRIAAENPLVSAHVYDLNHFPDLRRQYKVMSVPCLVIDDGKTSFGKKNIRQLLDLISL
ncbi:MAG: FAD-dependent oxidoreductase [Peptococcaceae bacterium]|nr:FAD-dependent oxidoreductase [Peptococcaceae bacterium]